ncbi:MAG: ABC transporter permease [Holosporaceae bacterium]|jgi:ABC-2 type transport system permease protein|nr:ABC transporter permease [Holosporaceae bacterium]
MAGFARTFVIFRKEFKHILRDPFTLLLVLFLPVTIVLILGNSMEFNLKEISTVIVDHDRTKESKKLIEALGSSQYFKTYFMENPAAAMEEIIREKAKAVVYIPPNFDNKISTGQSAEVQMIVDGADNTYSAAIFNYIGGVKSLAAKKILNQDANDDFFKIRFLFNPELTSAWFAVPGLSALIIALVSILLTSLTICREFESGSMELLLSTPVKTGEIIIGKILPYAFLSWIGFGIVHSAARGIFGVPFEGSWWILLSATAIFILDYLAIGLLISVVAKEQQLAVQLALGIGLIPTMLLSGFIFPIEYMPLFFRYFTMIFPARWYMEIVRDIYLKAIPFDAIVQPFLFIIFQGIILVAVSIAKFRRSIE